MSIFFIALGKKEKTKILTIEGKNDLDENGNNRFSATLQRDWQWVLSQIV